MSATARHRALQELFQRARRLAGDARDAWLDEACPPEMRAELDALLREDDNPVLADSAVAGAVQALARGLSEQQTGRAPAVPERIGDYAIIRLIGEGGMGVVYEAEQQDPRRRVALKVVRSRIVTRDLLQRFRHEAQVLGRLEHPGIARIYEAGTGDADSGDRPFFAMEFVAGRPLLDYAADAKLSIRSRLELVASICDAVQHAHQKGVVHRDLKPANILVDESGRPKILDFGVARATDADIHTVTVQTDLGQLVGTLPYMSPEQAAGDSTQIDIRSDVYALGVITYELLAGQLPYAVKGRVLHEAVRVIREDEASRLSSADRSLRGDVETIVAKALEKDKQRRYQSAAELAADIRHYLRDEPIVARPASAIYQLRKFARRNRALVGSVGAAFAVLLVAVVVVSILAVGQAKARLDAQAAQGKAEKEAAIATGVNTVLQDILAAANPWAATDEMEVTRDIKVAEVLDRSAAALDGAFHDQPEVEAAVRQTLGRTYLDLGRLQEARTQLEQAVALYGQSPGPGDLMTMRAENDLIQTLERAGDLPAAETLSRRVLDRQHSLELHDAPETLDTSTLRSVVLLRMDRLDEAEQLAIASLEGRRRVLGPREEETMISANNLALIYRAQRRHSEAETLLREVVAFRVETFGERKPETLVAISNLALNHYDQERYAEAERLQRRTLEIRLELFGEDHPGTLAAWNNLALTLRRTGQAEEAATIYEQMLDPVRRTLGPEHPHTLTTLGNLARAYRQLDRHAEAAALYEQVLDTRRRVLGDDHRTTVSAGCQLAEIYTMLGRYEDAERLALPCQRWQESNRGLESRSTQRSIRSLVDLYERWDRPDDAATWRTKLVEPP